MPGPARLNVAVVGSGISGLSAAWLLSKRHDVTLYEQADRIGGHSHTVTAQFSGRSVPVDMGFIVFNRVTYPNLAALFDHLDIPTEATEMSFAASLDSGGFEYSGASLTGLLAQRRNLVRPRFWSMTTDLLRFYREATRDCTSAGFEHISLGDYLLAGGYGAAFRDDHLLPMASAIWSATPSEILAYPAASFFRFHANHGLLQLKDRPVWETVTGGSISYVHKLLAPFADRIRRNTAATGILRLSGEVVITDSNAALTSFDHVVIATHADQALRILRDPSPEELSLLRAFRYRSNLAVLHSDDSFMPRRKAAWASWNYVGSNEVSQEPGYFTYWMNRLQHIPEEAPLFVTLNPPREPTAGTTHHSVVYEHPIFDLNAVAAQKTLWELQGRHRTWFCGAYFGHGFHEDGLQAGLAVAEELGGVRRPWIAPNESGRITLTRRTTPIDQHLGMTG